jgi:RHS repeat-associated protein
MNQYKFNVGTQSITGNTIWDPNGSLKQLAITNQLNSADTQTCNYTHEDLGRIDSVDCGAAKWQQNFTYDVFGNITKTVPGRGTGIGFQPDYSASSNWITSLPGIIPTTDADGRMTYDGTHNYAWDVEGKMVTVDATTLTYDALGRLVEKNVGSTINEFVFGPLGDKFAQMSGATLQKAFVPLPTKAAVYAGSGLAYYRHEDHLGSSRFATTPTRTMYSSTAYAPFGEPYSQAGTTDLSFAGHDQDTASGIHDALFRKYVPVQGRWLSPDPAGMAAVDPTNPQSWNRYAYVGNNPLGWTDPLGLLHCRSCGEGGWDSGFEAAPMRLGGDMPFGWQWDEFDIIEGSYECEYGDCERHHRIPDWVAAAMWPSGPLEIGGGAAPDSAPNNMLNYLKSCEGTAPGGGYGAYNDTQRNCTTGYGHLVHLHVCSTQEIAQYSSETQAQASAQLQNDYNSAAQWINSNAPGLNGGQQNAMIDLDFNMGPTRLQTHDVWRDVTSGNLNVVPGDIMTLRAGGSGIATRRANEVSMWNGGPIPAICY